LEGNIYVTDKISDMMAMQHIIRELKNRRVNSYTDLCDFTKYSHPRNRICIQP